MHTIENRKIDLSTIPHTIKNGKVHYNWKQSIGCECKFEYDNLSGIIKIVDMFRKSKYGQAYLKVEYNDNIFNIASSSFAYANLWNIVRHNGSAFLYHIGQHLVDKNIDLTILDREYRTSYTKIDNYKQTKKYYRVRCNKCGYETWKSEINVLGKNATGCQVCAGLKVLPGYNDIVTTDSWMVKYFPGGEEQAKNYTKWSTQKLELVCPDCGKKYIKSPLNIATIGKLACVCQDTMSYPNKFMYSFFSQLGVNFEIERTFPWSQRKIYDDYIIFDDDRTLICENHGAWHYEEKCTKRTNSLEERQRIDKLKRQLAEENGVTYYVELDCHRSDKNLIQNSIESSILSELFDLSNIDYNECDRFASDNFMKTVCDYKHDNPNVFVVDIAKHFNISKYRVRKYLKSGNDLGWCEYNPDTENVRKSRSINGRNQQSMPLQCIETNKYYRDARHFVSSYYNETGDKVNYTSVLAVCHGKANHTHNLHFKFITQEEFNKMKSSHPEKVVGEYFDVA